MKIKKEPAFQPTPQNKMAGPTRFELATSGVVKERIKQLLMKYEIDDALLQQPDNLHPMLR